MDVYTTKQNETLDLVCWRHYHSPNLDHLAAVIEANPQLADAPSILPFATRVNLPVVEKNDTVPALTRLWD